MHNKLDSYTQGTQNLRVIIFGQPTKKLRCKYHPGEVTFVTGLADTCDGSHCQTMPVLRKNDTVTDVLSREHRPRITISIIAPNHDYDQEFITLDLPPGLSVGDLKGFVNAETNLPQAAQQFYLNNTPLSSDERTLEEAGIKDGDMLAMLMRQPDQQNNMGAQRREQRRQGGQGSHEIETTRLSILGNPAAMAQVRQQRPALAEAINDGNRFREVWEHMMREDHDREQERQEQMRLLNEDPFNVDAQRKIEEMIRQESVQENLQFAYEHNPEG